jgi:hypothetical protein
MDNERKNPESEKTNFSLILLLVILPICIFKLAFVLTVFDESILAQTGLRIIAVLFMISLWIKLVPKFKKREKQINKLIYVSAIVFSVLIFLMMFGMLLLMFLPILNIVT